MIDLAQHIRRQMEWSSKTFGHGRRTEGILQHLRKELNEVEANPDDVFEWVDIIILAIDGAWRHGWKPEVIVEALVTKQLYNERRKWPPLSEQSEDKATEHVR